MDIKYVDIVRFSHTLIKCLFQLANLTIPSSSFTPFPPILLNERTDQ